jgi:hypothetical protein
MKALAWYAIVFNILVVIAFMLLLTGVISQPPLTALEDIAWAVLSVPVVILGIMVIRKPE